MIHPPATKLQIATVNIIRLRNLHFLGKSLGVSWLNYSTRRKTYGGVDGVYRALQGLAQKATSCAKCASVCIIACEHTQQGHGDDLQIEG
jgi:hypothetical protein